MNNFFLDRMSGKTNLIRALKNGALILIAASLGAYFSCLHYSQRETTKPEIIIQFEDDFQYFPSALPQFSKDVLSQNFDDCFFESFITEVGETITGLGRDSHANSLKYNDFKEVRAGAGKEIGSRSLISVLTEFADLMSTLSIEAVLIEPSIIYCMLSPFYKRILLKRKLEPEMYFKSQQVLTFGIRAKYIPILIKAATQMRIRDANFTIEFVREPSPQWMQTTPTNFPSHLFFKGGAFTVHAVVFYKRGDYLWHGAIRQTQQNTPQREVLHFAEADSAYDSLIPVRPGFSQKSLTNVLIPSDPPHFLFQIPTSKFLECNAEVVKRFQHVSSNMKVEELPSPLAQHRFRVKIVAALRALKTKLTPLLMRYWIWSGTMLGWYRQCGVIPYTTDIDFAAWAEEVEDLNTILQLFQRDDHLTLKETMGMVQQGLELYLDYHTLKVDLFFLYTESNGTWYAGHGIGRRYFFKYHHPNFSLCSADLLGHKVLVPCEPEKNIRAEYGPNWMQPVSSWHYQSSIYNRGPDIYWNETKINAS